MNTLHHLLRHPTGRFGLTLGLMLGIVAALRGEASKALLFIGLCQFLAHLLGQRYLNFVQIVPACWQEKGTCAKNDDGAYLSQESNTCDKEDHLNGKEISQ